MSFKYKIIFLAPLFVLGCKKEDAPIASEPRVVQMAEISKDVQLPSSLWDKVMEATFEESVKKGSSFIFAPISIIMEEKNSGVLTEPKIKLDFPKAGGEVDFAKYVKNERGTFRVSFDFAGFSDAESLKVYYVSKARKRKLDGEIYGSGCNVFFDIKDYMTKINEKEGFVVNVTRDRHDSAMGGHFIFSYKKNKQLYISEVTFVDSKRPDLFCEVAER